MINTLCHLQALRQASHRHAEQADGLAAAAFEGRSGGGGGAGLRRRVREKGGKGHFGKRGEGKPRVESG